jgi:hypothetical protein
MVRAGRIEGFTFPPGFLSFSLSCLFLLALVVIRGASGCLARKHPMACCDVPFVCADRSHLMCSGGLSFFFLSFFVVRSLGAIAVP